MKKICFVLIMFIVLNSCNNSSTDNATNKENGGTDSTGLTNPTSIDTIKHPSGIDNSSAISTDTAAMNVQNSIKKSDSVTKAKAK